MCPEMNLKSVSFNRSALVRVIALLMVSFLALGGCSVFNADPLQRIPELEYVEEISKGYFTTYCCVYDGVNYSSVSKRPIYKEDAEDIADMVHVFCSIKGRKVSDWSTDKITYPVYALSIEPRKMGEDKPVSETVVWTNGYLITSTGNVYLANPDFKPFLKAAEKDYTVDTEMESIAYTRTFRPLAAAGQKWHADIMRPSLVTDDKVCDGIEVKVTDQFEKDGYPYLSVEITNNRDERWYYCDSSIFVGLDVVVNGEYYYLYHDPDIHDDYLTQPGYDAFIEPGETVKEEFCYGLYGTKLPKSEYRLLISSKENNETKYACGVFILK